MNIRNNKINIIVVMLLSTLFGCKGTIDKLKQVGSAPEFNQIKVPEYEQQSTMDVTEEEKKFAQIKQTNSLWNEQFTSFLDNNKVWKVGDILKIRVKIGDSVTFNNSSAQARKTGSKLDIAKLLGLETTLATRMFGTAILGNILDAVGDSRYDAKAGISRKEDLKTELAATVVQVLKNNNLIISAHQEVRVNNELREIKIAGIIRPQDIKADNSIDFNQIAEARISYGGRGPGANIQQPPIGNQVLDIISPF